MSTQAPERTPAAFIRPEAAALLGQTSRPSRSPHGDQPLRPGQSAQGGKPGQAGHAARLGQQPRAASSDPSAASALLDPARRHPLTIKQVEYFVAAVECGSLTAAAEEKDITVQGMSQAIADIEREIGTFLLERGRQGTAPTAFGFECYVRAKSLLLHFSEFEAFLRSQKRSPQ